MQNSGMDDKNLKRPPLYLYSKDEGGQFYGVCKGLSVHLRVDVNFVRLLFIFLSLLAGVGVFLYVWFMVFIPKKVVDKVEIKPLSQTNSISKPVTVKTSSSNVFEISSLQFFVYAIIFFLIIYNFVFAGSSTNLKSAILFFILGVSMVWFKSIIDYRKNVFSYKTIFSLEYVVGSLVSIGSVFFLLVTQSWVNDIAYTLVVSFVSVIVAIFLFLPIGIMLFKTLTDSQYEKSIEEERANIAAHLHDGVLQTLTLIQQNSTNSEEVEYLAKTQERDLRAWLYGDRPDEGTSTSAIIKENISEIEDKYRKNIDLIVVGDTVPNSQTHSFVGALREASINGIIHGELPVSVYVEINSRVLEFFVRDRGKGFDVDSIPEERLGVRNSIFKRVENAGGRVDIKTTNGCEVHVEIPNEE